ncbi:curli assembly protein CsgF [Vibrio sp. Isolate22]|uniref:curli assembly protein CsgF n=1 Tax=Vibrio sp. Isolate22 TaxID=2908532 RepID=UPI001EFDC6C8|nr:curli assembly protein CsgF [Vibrio sp. Isolate22]MCG9692668.1 curli assembly protein CsgF [Vibrio sp. Isolate22]
MKLPYMLLIISWSVSSAQVTYNLTNPAFGGYNPGFVNAAKERISIVEKNKSQEQRILKEIKRKEANENRNNPSKQLERTLVNYINAQVSEKIARSIFDENKGEGSIKVSDSLNLDYEKTGDILKINISGEGGDQNIELSVPGIGG